MNNNVWDFDKFMSKVYPDSKRTNEHVCSFFSFNKEIHPLFEACRVMPFICKYDL